jgi:hypothetical protein
MARAIDRISIRGFFRMCRTQALPRAFCEAELPPALSLPRASGSVFPKLTTFVPQLQQPKRVRESLSVSGPFNSA